MGNDILVIGTTFESEKVDSCDWNSIVYFNSLSNYKFVILDFVSLVKAFREKKFLRTELFPADGGFDQFRFDENHELIVIGNPGELKYENGRTINPLSLIDFRPQLVRSKGDNFKKISDEFNYYLKVVKKWSSSLISQDLESKNYGIPLYVTYNYNFKDKEKMGVKITPFAVNNSNHPIAFSFQYNVKGYEKPVFSTYHHKSITSAKYIYLPETTVIDVSEGIKLILKERYKINIDTPAPSWIKEFKLPDQESIEKNTEKISGRISDLQTEIEENNLKLIDQKKFQKLIYESGGPLNDIVLDVFGLFGAKAIHNEKFQDDGKLEYNKQHGILEVKGKKRACETKDIRQLADWRDEAGKEDGVKFKGILVLNSDREKAPSDRINPFSSDCLRIARNENIALIDTVDLYNLLKVHQEGKLDYNKFWSIVFKTDEICDFSKLINI